MSRCIGKFVEKNTDILNRISDKLEDSDRCEVTTTACLIAACRQYFSDFENMWSQKKYYEDLRVVLVLLLRSHLAKRRFSRNRNRVYKAKKSTTDKTCRPVSESRHMSLLKSLFLDVITSPPDSITTEQEESMSEDGDAEDDEDFLVSKNLYHYEEEEQRDLTAREINAIVAVSKMLCIYSVIVGQINPNYLKAELYKDKQDSIPPTAILLCTDVVNILQ
ncbi:hypothetical protein [Parasitella parasitica]|uniref:Uncharacterized protein n=1 Tax=Parasitella parasitica TaxID=35722 RepID=A0A0B7MU67_9FUNG|nr:hypothetical protein [Parasitella parasitica]